MLNMDRRRFFLGLTAVSSLGLSILANRNRGLESLLTSEPACLAVGGFEARGRRYFVAALESYTGGFKVKSAPIGFRPHDFESLNDCVIAIEKAGPNLSLVSLKSGIASTYLAPDGLYLYGHGLVLDRIKRTVAISAYRSDGYGERNARSGFLVVGTVNPTGEAFEFTNIVELPGFVPHDLVFSETRKEIFCTIKNGPDGLSKILRLNSADFSVRESLTVGAFEAQETAKNVTHLHVDGNSVFYSYNEFRKGKFCGGGIGQFRYFDSSPAIRVFDQSYSDVLRRRFPNKKYDTLDVLYREGVASVTVPGCGAIVDYNIGSKEIQLSEISGISGISLYRRGSEQKTDELQLRGSGFLIKGWDGVQTPVSVGEDLWAVSHLCVNRMQG